MQVIADEVITFHRLESLCDRVGLLSYTFSFCLARVIHAFTRFDSIEEIQQQSTQILPEKLKQQQMGPKVIFSIVQKCESKKRFDVQCHGLLSNSTSTCATLRYNWMCVVRCGVCGVVRVLWCDVVCCGVLWCV